jgi:hypothetical protein
VPRMVTKACSLILNDLNLNLAGLSPTSDSICTESNIFRDFCWQSHRFFTLLSGTLLNVTLAQAKKNAGLSKQGGVECE